MNGSALPPWQLGLKRYNLVLQDAKRKGADCICGRNARPVLVVDGYAMVRVRNICDLGVEHEARVILSEESRSLLGDNVAIAAGINYKVILVAKLIECQVSASNTKNERRLLRRVGIFPI